MRAIAQRGGGRDAREPPTDSVQFDWDEPTKVVRLVIDQNKARLLGFSSQDVAAFLNNSVSGVTVTNYRERDKQIDVRGARRAGRARARCRRSRTWRCRPRRQGGPDHADRRRSATSSRKASSGAATGCRRSPCAPTSQGRRAGPRRRRAGSTRSSTPVRAHAAARLPDRDRRRDRGFGAGAETRSPPACRCSWSSC